MRDVAQMVTFQEVKKNETIYSDGQQVDKFYIVIDGGVNIQERNDKIPDFDWALNIFKTLSTWKENVFEKNVQNLMY